MGKVGEEAEIEAGAQIVGIGDEGVANTIGKQSLQPTGADKRGVNVSMTGWTPFELRIGGSRDGPQGGGVDFRNEALHQLELFRFAEFRIFC